MAMKPAGKAIVAALVVLGAIAGAHFSGAFDKLKKQGEAAQVAAPVVEQSAPAPVAVQPEPAPAPVAAPAPSLPQPYSSPIRQADALDQLIRQSGTK